MSTLIARTTTKAVTPIILLTSIAILLQGHNLPGGGFIAGVIYYCRFCTLVYNVQYIDYLEKDVLNHRRKTIVESFEHSIQEDYEDIISIGLLIAVTTGLVAIFYNLPFFDPGLLDIPLADLHRVAYRLSICIRSRSLCGCSRSLTNSSISGGRTMIQNPKRFSIKRKTTMIFK